MSRPRKSEFEHALTGTVSAATLPDEDNAPSRPKYPRGISPEAKRTFKRLCRLLERRRTLTEGDGELLRLYAIAYTRHERALEHIAAEGEIVSYTKTDAHGDHPRRGEALLRIQTEGLRETQHSDPGRAYRRD